MNRKAGEKIVESAHANLRWREDCPMRSTEKIPHDPLSKALVMIVSTFLSWKRAHGGVSKQRGSTILTRESTAANLRALGMLLLSLSFSL